MSIGKLRRAVDALPQKRTSRHVEELARSVGDKVNDQERHVLSDLLESEWRSFGSKALYDLERLAGRASPKTQPVTFKVGKKVSSGVEEVSSVTHLGKAGLVAIDDFSSVVWHLSKSGAKPVALRTDDDSFDDLEGLAFDPETSTLLLLEEATSRLFSVECDIDGSAVTLGEPKLLSKLEPVGKDKASRYEGLTIWPAAHAPGKKPRLLACNEKDPLELSVFDAKSLALQAEVSIPKSLGLLDLSDLAVDPKTGHIFLLSDESQCVVEVELRRDAKVLGPGPLGSEWSVVEIGRTQLPGLEGPIRLQPEGITFDSNGDLWIVSEGDRSLMHLERK